VPCCLQGTACLEPPHPPSKPHLTHSSFSRQIRSKRGGQLGCRGRGDAGGKIPAARAELCQPPPATSGEGRRGSSGGRGSLCLRCVRLLRPSSPPRPDRLRRPAARRRTPPPCAARRRPPPSSAAHRPPPPPCCTPASAEHRRPLLLERSLQPDSRTVSVAFCRYNFCDFCDVSVMM
jgi:hypothetical protein